jgi:hypothetical protein
VTLAEATAAVPLLFIALTRPRATNPKDAAMQPATHTSANQAAHLAREIGLEGHALEDRIATLASTLATVDYTAAIVPAEAVLATDATPRTQVRSGAYRADEVASRALNGAKRALDQLQRHAHNIAVAADHAH